VVLRLDATFVFPPKAIIHSLRSLTQEGLTAFVFSLVYVSIVHQSGWVGLRGDMSLLDSFNMSLFVSLTT